MEVAYAMKSKYMKEKNLDKLIARQKIDNCSVPSFQMYRRPKLQKKSTIINEDYFECIWTYMPERFKMKDPLLIYNTEKDGTSWTTFKSRIYGNIPLFILVESFTKGLCDNDNVEVHGVFGAMLIQPINEKTHVSNDKESFLFVLSPHQKKFECVDNKKTSDIAAVMENDFFGVGTGGEVGYGLVIESSLTEGSSHKCDTYQNEPLNGKEKKFGIKCIEIFKLI